MMKFHAQIGYLIRFVLKGLKKNEIWESVTNLPKRFTIQDLGKKVHEHLKGRKISIFGSIRKAFMIQLNQIKWFLKLKFELNILIPSFKIF